MHRAKQQFGKINPNVPEELVRFAFLVGSWRFEAKVKLHALGAYRIPWETGLHPNLVSSENRKSRGLYQRMDGFVV